MSKATHSFSLVRFLRFKARASRRRWIFDLVPEPFLRPPSQSRFNYKLAIHSILSFFVIEGSLSSFLPSLRSMPHLRASQEQSQWKEGGN